MILAIDPFEQQCLRATLEMDINENMYEWVRGYPAQRALSAMRKHGG